VVLQSVARKMQPAAGIEMLLRVRGPGSGIRNLDPVRATAPLSNVALFDTSNIYHSCLSRSKTALIQVY
jgi:hypothetical protein